MRKRESEIVQESESSRERESERARERESEKARMRESERARERESERVSSQTWRPYMYSLLRTSLASAPQICQGNSGCGCQTPTHTQRTSLRRRSPLCVTGCVSSRTREQAASMQTRHCPWMPPKGHMRGSKACTSASPRECTHTHLRDEEPC